MTLKAGVIGVVVDGSSLMYVPLSKYSGDGLDCLEASLENTCKEGGSGTLEAEDPRCAVFLSFGGALPPWNNLTPKARRLPCARNWRRPAA